MIRPIDDIVVVAPVLGRTPIELLNTRMYHRGRVLAAGPKCTEVKVNDTVHLEPCRSIEAVFDGKPAWITREEQILAVEE